MKQPEQTKEEIIAAAFRRLVIRESTAVVIGDAMEEYASQKCKALQEENERLKDLLTQTKQHVIPSYCELREKIHKALTGSQSKD